MTKEKQEIKQPFINDSLSNQQYVNLSKWEIIRIVLFAIFGILSFGFLIFVIIKCSTKKSEYCF